MKRGLFLILFYSSLALAVADLYAVSDRYSLESPDPISWLKVVFAALIQLMAFGLGYAYVWFLSKYGKAETAPNAILDTLRLRLAPAIGLGLIAAYSYTMLYNGVNCGNHPLPTSRGMTTCPN